MGGAAVGAAAGFFLDMFSLLAIVGFAVGAIAPYMIVSGEAQERIKNISRGLPYVIDLMALAEIDKETEVTYIRREVDWVERARAEGRLYDSARLLPVLPPTLTGIAPGGRTNGNGHDGHGHDGHGAVAALGPGQHE